MNLMFVTAYASRPRLKVVRVLLGLHAPTSVRCLLSLRLRLPLFDGSNYGLLFGWASVRKNLGRQGHRADSEANDNKK
jgi:hypothetical protein